jgi:hypothetical protein
MRLVINYSLNARTSATEFVKRTIVTAIECISANGRSLLLMII